MAGQGGADWAFTLFDLVAYYMVTEPAFTRVFEGRQLTKEELSMLFTSFVFVRWACKGLYYPPGAGAPVRAPALGWTAPTTITFKHL
jgi:hypothetical protein